MSQTGKVIPLNLEDVSKTVAVSLMREYFEIAEIQDRSVRKRRFVEWDRRAMQNKVRLIKRSQPF